MGRTMSRCSSRSPFWHANNCTQWASNREFLYRRALRTNHSLTIDMGRPIRASIHVVSELVEIGFKKTSETFHPGLRSFFFFFFLFFLPGFHFIFPFYLFFFVLISLLIFYLPSFLLEKMCEPFQIHVTFWNWWQFFKFMNDLIIHKHFVNTRTFLIPNHFFQFM